MSSRRCALTLLVALVGVGAFPSGAGAGIANFSMSPSSGPPGTTVSVSGTGCAPGLLLSSSQDFVAVSATTVPPVSKHIAVAANGTWSDTISIPANATAAPAVVAALCFSDGLQSLLTIYVPQTFTVTQAAPTTTAPGAPATTTPTTLGSTPPADVPSTTAPTGTTVGTTPGPTTPDPTPTTDPGTPPPKQKGNNPPKRESGGGTGGGGNRGGGTTNTGPTIPGTTDGGALPVPSATSPSIGGVPDGFGLNLHPAAKASPRAQAADLGDPTLASAIRTGHSNRLGWLGWLLLVVVIAALVALGLWMYRSRRRDLGVQSP